MGSYKLEAKNWNIQNLWNRVQHGLVTIIKFPFAPSQALIG